MAIVLDLIILAIIILCAFVGYKKGLTKSLIKIFSFIIAIVVAALFFKPISDFVIEKTQIDETIRDAVISVVKDDIDEDGEVKEESNLPKAMVQYINNSVKNAVSETKDAIVHRVADGIAVGAINVGVAVLLFILVRATLLIISLMSDFLTDLPVIKQFDKTGGVIYGILESVVIISVVFLVISLISPLIEGTGIVAIINKSYIGSILYDNNLLLKLIFNK